MTEAIHFNTCFSRHGNTGQYDFMVNGVFLSPEIISIQMRANWYCGGAHPDGEDRNININALDGNEWNDLDDVCWLAGTKPDLRNDSSYYKYIDSRGAAIVEILTKLYPKEMSKPDSVDQESCDYSNSYDWNFPVWYFKKEGLHIEPNFPHALQACGGPEFSVIPYFLLKQYLNKEKQIRLPKN
jgi:hypothetical protein